jgi:hypothetical protein
LNYEKDKKITDTNENFVINSSAICIEIHVFFTGSSGICMEWWNFKVVGIHQSFLSMLALPGVARRAHKIGERVCNKYIFNERIGVEEDFWWELVVFFFCCTSSGALQVDLTIG